MSFPSESGASGAVGSVLDVQWIPDDRIMTWSTDLKLFRTRTGTLEDQETDVNRVQMSGDSIAELECQIPEPPHYIKCVQVYPGLIDGSDVRFAVGQASGKVTLMSFDEVNHIGSHPHVIKEFAPKIARICHDLSWNIKKPNLLAAGYERSRQDAAVLVYDTNRYAGSQSLLQLLPTSGASAAETTAAEVTANKTPDDCIPPVVEIGVGETCYSLSWFRDQVDNLVCGINAKNLKVFDVRCTAKPVMVNYTRNVHGVCIDPWLDFRIASHNDNQLTIWDTRNFERPVVTLQQSERVCKLSWSPTRSGLLASVTEKGTNVRLHDIQSWAVMTEDGDPAVIERDVNFCENNEDISSFAWHPDQGNVLVAVMKTGRLSKVVVPERMTPSWSNTHTLVWPKAGTLRVLSRQSSIYEGIFDVSVLMIERAEQMIYNNEMTCSSLKPHLDNATLEGKQSISIFSFLSWPIPKFSSFGFVYDSTETRFPEIKNVKNIFIKFSFKFLQHGNGYSDAEC